MKSNRVNQVYALLRPTPGFTFPVFAGLGLHSARHGTDSLDWISLSSTVFHIQQTTVKALCDEVLNLTGQ